MDQKKTMDCTEPAVMDSEKWDCDQFTDMIRSLTRPENRHFQNVVEDSDKVLYPVEQDDEFYIPAEQENTDNGNKVGPNKSPKRQGIFLLEQPHKPHQINRARMSGRLTIDIPVCKAMMEDINLVSPPSCFARI